MNFRFFESGDLEAITRLNGRIRAGGRREKTTLRPTLEGEARYRPEGFPVHRRLMIAEDGQEVRATALLYHHNIFIHGENRSFCWLDNAICEGIVDRKYSLSILQLVKRALTYQPFQMTLGVGNPDVVAHQLWIKLGWKHSLVPFFFYPVKVTNVLLGLTYLKRLPALRVGTSLAAYSGLGAGLGGLLRLRGRIGASLSAYESTEEKQFDEWADRVFAEAVPDYGAAIRSDATALNIVYSPDNPVFTRLRVKRKLTGKEVGWILIVTKQMHNNSYFGNLRVGTLADGFGRAEDVPALIAAGLNRLAEAGVDIVVANFSHAAWVSACRRSGMFSGPSNYYLFVSPGGSPMLEESCPLHQIHVGRGHGDGLEALVPDEYSPSRLHSS